MAHDDTDRLLDELTLREKASLVIGADFWHTASVDRLGVAGVMVTDGPHGLRKQPAEVDHVAIGGSVPATCFPTASGLASSWDRALVARVGEALAEEALDQEVSVILGPGVNMKRSPLCGRNFEYFAEDPWLAGQLALSLVRAIQARGVGTSLKHYAANNQEDDRLRVSAEVDERTLRECYLPAFETVVTGAQPWTVMCAYNKVNGTYASEHHWLLTEVLREEWGFDGMVVSDWGAVHDRVAALRAGLDLEMPPALGRSDAAVVDAVGSGALDPETLDRSVARVLRLSQRSRPAPGTDREPVSYEQHHRLAREAAARSAVLLKNDRDVLPLDLAAGSTVAVIGAFATTPRFQGAGSSQVNPTTVDVPLDELRAALPDEVELRFAQGFALEDDADDAALLEEAVATARGADVVLLFVGLPDAAESEGFDRTSLELPAGQVSLIEAVAGVAADSVAVLANGSVVTLSGWEHHVDAVLECWLGGQAVGGAVADLLTGAANPSGKLAETIPVRLEDNPSFLTFPGDSQLVRYGEGLFIGYRGYDALHHEVTRPFGFGLCYTTFELGTPRVTVAGSVAGDDLAATVSVTVTNTGARAGAEVVQLYVADPECSVTRPARELKAFERIALEPGGSGEVQLHLDQRAFAYWSVRLRRWVVEAGTFHLYVGTSSRDLPHRLVVEVDAPSVAPPVDRDSTLHEWLADERARSLLDRAAAEQSLGDGLLTDPAMIRVIGTMPISTLAGFGMAGFTHDRLDELVAQL
jgi:beta-glucosidase